MFCCGSAQLHESFYPQQVPATPSERRNDSRDVKSADAHSPLDRMRCTISNTTLRRRVDCSLTSEEEASEVGLDIRVVPAKDGSAVRAEGLTHHQAKLISLHEAQKDAGIKYRSLTQSRGDLLEVANAQEVRAIKYRNLKACF